MGKFYDEIPEFLVPWIEQQKMFWVASAPLNPDGHINVSPKGFEGSFHIKNSKQVWYEDLTGSGIETISHLRENGRITVMFTAFEGPPRICRLFGKGTVYEYGSPEYNALISPDNRQPGSRSVIMVDVYKVGSSCGYSIPFYAFKGLRMKLHNMFAQKEDLDTAAAEQLSASCDAASNPAPPCPEGGLRIYWWKKNAESLDGLPGLHSAHEARTRFSHVDPKSLGGDQDGANEGARKLRLSPKIFTEWVNPQTVVAFTLGAVTAITALRALHQQQH